MNQELIAAEWRRGISALHAARLMQAEGLYEDSVSRAYYSIFHAARTALHLHSVTTRSHRGIRRLFGLHLIKPGHIEAQWSPYLAGSLDERIAADYNVAVTFGEQETQEACERAEAFLRRIREYLLQQGVAPADLPLTPPKR